MSVDTASREADDLVIELMSSPPPQNPYPLFNRLREIAPDHQGVFGLRCISSYAGSVELLRSPDVGQSMGLDEAQTAASTYFETVKEMLPMTNPPVHTRLRRLVQRVFSPKFVEDMTAKIQGVVDERMDAFDEKGVVDLVSDFAIPIPGIVLCDLFGTPWSDRDLIEEWAEATSTVVKPVIQPEELERANRAVTELHAYILDAAAERRKNPGDDLLSLLVAAEDEGERLSTKELLNMCFTLITAGMETTASAISSAALLLMQNPDQLALLQKNPQLLRNAVEECLRMEPPVQNSFTRVALQDTLLCGRPVEKGQRMVAMIGAANRDPAKFEHPDELHIDRDDAGSHLSFSNGPHFCLGRHLALLETTTAIGSLFARYPNIAMVDPTPDWRPVFTARRVGTLRVTL